MKPAADWQATEKVTPRYGYGYAATSLQLAAAVNTIANGGVYVAPRLVLSTIDANGQTHKAPAFAHARGRDAPNRGHNDVDDEGCGLLRHGEVRQGAGHVGCGQDGHGAAEAREDLRPDWCTHEVTITDADLTARRTPTIGPTTGPRSTSRPSSATSRPTTRRSRSSFRSTVPIRPTRTTSAARAAGPLFSTLATMAMHELRVSPSPNDNGCQEAQDDTDVSHASRGGRAGGT